MRNNKKTLFILIPLMIVVWGGIVFQIISGISSDEEVQTTPFAEMKVKEEILDTVDYNLVLNYKDPFQVSKSAKRVTKRQNPSKRQSSSKKVNFKNKKPENKIIWPEIRYNGIVKSSNSKTVGLLTIASTSFLAKVGESYKSVKVLHFSENEIALEFEGEEKTIMK